MPWIADFRDPWVSMDYLQEMYLGKRAKRKHQEQEASVINEADEVVVVGKTMYNEFYENYGKESVIIHNGYVQSEDQIEKFSLDKKFTIVHIGSFLKNRNCDDLWKTLKVLCEKNTQFSENLEIKLIGNVAPNVMESIDRFGLNDHLNKIDYIPFSETQRHLFGAQVLLLPIDRIKNAEFVLTGKLFEYLKSKRPILLIGPEKGDAAHIINNCKAGHVCDFDNLEQIESAVLERFNLYLNNDNHIDSVNVENYSDVELTKKLTQLFDSVRRTHLNSKNNKK